MQRKINSLTVQQILQGAMETGVTSVSYYYMTQEGFLEEIMKSPNESLLEYIPEEGWRRKWSKLPVWVLTYGLQK